MAAVEVSVDTASENVTTVLDESTLQPPALPLGEAHEMGENFCMYRYCSPFLKNESLKSSMLCGSPPAGELELGARNTK